MDERVIWNENDYRPWHKPQKPTREELRLDAERCFKRHGKNLAYLEEILAKTDTSRDRVAVLQNCHSWNINKRSYYQREMERLTATFRP